MFLIFNTYITELDLLLQKDSLRYIIAVVLGLCIGSFLNVVIVRLPVILKHKWAKQSLEFLEEENLDPELLEQVTINLNLKSTSEKISLSFPASHCVCCQQKLQFWMNLPILSYLFLKGRCYFCSKKISICYPIVELVTALLFGYISYLYKDLLHLLEYFIFFSVIIVAAIIDFQTMLLPDEITLPFLWLGLLFNIQGFISGSLLSSIIGAILGYVFLATIYWTFKILTKKEGMGFGDFKFLAAIGSWLGVNYIIPIAMISSISTIIYAIALFLIKRKNLTTAVPFGPFLALAAGLCVLLVNYIQPSSII